MNWFVDFNSQLESDGSIWVWSYSYTPPKKIKIKITLTKNKEIQYWGDGSILRIDQVKDTSNRYQILTNLEQIEYLQWSGNFGENNQQIGRWTATWKWESLKTIGGEYSIEGKKQGQWMEIRKHFWKYMKLESTLMARGKQFGSTYIMINGGGSYDVEGYEIKTGRWIELNDDFCQQCQVTYNGEYKNGNKVGRWDILLKGLGEIKFNQIGGGTYDKGEGNVKLGRWIELQDGFNNYSQVTYNGEYKNGKKIGLWNTFYRQYDYVEFRQLGCGSYANGIKTGKWIELQDGFSCYSSVTYNGDYKNGNKIGRWDIFYKIYGEKEFKQIGGGFYDEGCNGIKVGRWIMLKDKFVCSSQVTYNGEYQNGKKFGKWDICYRRIGEKEFQYIGGGSYDEGGNEKKNGKWIELADQFNYFDFQTQGEYKNGKKVGRWDIFYKIYGEKELKQIGGGLYDEGCNGIKNGRWIELDNRFDDNYQITYYGRYLQGKKVGRWDMYYRKPNEQEFNQIGGGSYDEGGNGKKTGRWIELADGYNQYSQVTCGGEYNNGKKVGIWVKQGLNYGKWVYKEQKYDY